MRNQIGAAPVRLDLLDLSEWTEIARLNPHEGTRWIPIDCAPMRVAEARKLHQAGLLLMAHRVRDAGTFIVVKTPSVSLQSPRRLG